MDTDRLSYGSSKSQPPKWFVEKLDLLPYGQILSLDDDLNIHEIWKGRFQSLNINQYNIEHFAFVSGIEFKEWIKSRLLPTALTKRDSASAAAANPPRLYLVDFELLNQNATGLEIIEELGISQQSVLVTSRYEEANIQEKCEKMGVRLIPKSMADFVPMQIVSP